MSMLRSLMLLVGRSKRSSSIDENILWMIDDRFWREVRAVSHHLGHGACAQKDTPF
jgi:hypothetical protein